MSRAAPAASQSRARRQRAIRAGRRPNGGFGWAVRQVTECFQRDPSLGVDVVLLMGEPPATRRALPATVHGAPVIWPLGSLPLQVARVRRERPDLFLSIDYRSSYRRFFYVLPTTPIVVWVRDPRTRVDRENVRTVRIPGVDVVPGAPVGPSVCGGAAPPEPA